MYVIIVVIIMLEWFLLFVVGSCNHHNYDDNVSIIIMIYITIKMLKGVISICGKRLPIIFMLHDDAL